jgi:hypothetical protein
MQIDYCNDIETAISIVSKKFYGKTYSDIFWSNNQDIPQKANIFALSAFTDSNLNDIVLFLYKNPGKRFFIRCVQYKYDKLKERWNSWCYSQFEEGCRDRRLNLPQDFYSIVIGEGSTTMVLTKKEFWNIIEKNALL